MRHNDWLAVQALEDTRAMAPTHPDATARHWPKPKPACERCGVRGHIESMCVYEEGEL